MTTTASLVSARSRVVAWCERRPDFSWAPPRRMAVTAVVIAALAYSIVAWNSRFPTIALDEIVMVANSRVIAGQSPAWELQGWGFMPGFAVLLAPAWWFTDDPVIVYRAGIAISSILGVLTIWPLSSLARRVGASPTGAVAMASAVAVAPARLLLTNYLLSEAAFVLATACVFVAAARLVEMPTWTRAGTLGVLTGATVLAHLRGASLAIALGVWGLTVLTRTRWFIFVAGAAAILTTLGAYGLYNWVTSLTFSSDDQRVSSTFAGAVGRSLGDVAASIVGQSWYAVFAWGGLTIVGVMWCVRHLASNSLARLIALAAVSSFVLSTIGLNAKVGVSTPDAWYYGRYNEHMWIVLATVGLAAVTRLRWIVVSGLTVAVSAFVAAAMWAIVVPRVGVSGDPWSEFNTFGVSPWLSMDRYVAGEPQAWGVLCVGSVLLSSFVVCAAWWRGSAVVGALVCWTAVSIWHDGTFLDVVEERGPSVPADTELWEMLPEQTTVGVSTSLGVHGNFFVLYSGSHETEFVVLDAIPQDIEVVYASMLAPEPELAGAKILDVWDGFWVIWVYPGELYDELDEKGLLVSP